MRYEWRGIYLVVGDLRCYTVNAYGYEPVHKQEQELSADETHLEFQSDSISLRDVQRLHKFLANAIYTFHVVQDWCLYGKTAHPRASPDVFRGAY